MNDNSKDPSLTKDTLANRRDASDARVYKTCLSISVIWMSVGIVYFLCQPSNFIRMWPHEVGALLSGWVAPLATLWVFAAVILQRAQLEAQRRQLEQTREQLEKSISHLERSALTSQLARLSERVMRGTLRFVRTGEAGSLYLQKQGQREPVAQLVGHYRRYAELFKGNEPSLVLERLGRGLGMVVARMNDDWMMHGDVEVVEELATELSSLTRIVSEIQQCSAKIPSVGGESPLKDDTLERFRASATKASMTLESMLHELRTFDVPDDVASGVKVSELRL